MCSRRSNGRWQVIAWTISFVIWYLMFAASFCGYLHAYAPMSPNIAALAAYLLVWHALWIMAMWSLYEAVLTPPPPIPLACLLAPEDRPTGEKAEDVARYFEKLASVADARGLTMRRNRVKTMTGGWVMMPPYCVHCCAFKPDRTHHCSQCDRCVARMDHHCPVLGTCVHFGNHKQFLLFLFWAWMLCVYTCALCCTYIGLIVSGGLNNFPIDKIIPLALTAVGSSNAFACLLSLSFFLGSLLLQLLRNDTTLDKIGRRTYGPQDPHGEGHEVYDLGSRFENFKAVFGNKPHLWLLPVHSASGDGFTFKGIRTPVVTSDQ